MANKKAKIAEKLRAENAAALAAIDTAQATGQTLAEAERARIVDQYHGAGGTIATTTHDFLSGKRRQETQQQYFTPTWFGRFMFDLLGAPDDAAFFDPAVGTGRMYWDFRERIFLTGIEKDAEVFRVAHSLFGDSPRAALIRDDMKLHHLREVADYALGNPPFSIRLYDVRNLVPEAFKSQAGTIRSDQFFVWSVLEALKLGGTAAVIAPDKFLHGNRRLENWLRTVANLLAIVRVPSGVITEASWDFDTTVWLFQKIATEQPWGPLLAKAEKSVRDALGDRVSQFSPVQIFNTAISKWPKEAPRPTPKETQVLAAIRKRGYTGPVEVMFDGTNADAVRDQIRERYGERVDAYAQSLDPRTRPIEIHPAETINPRVAQLVDEAESLAELLPLEPPPIADPLPGSAPPAIGQPHLSVGITAGDGEIASGTVAVPDSAESLALLTYLRLLEGDTDTRTVNHRNKFLDLRRNFLMFHEEIVDGLNQFNLRPALFADDAERLAQYEAWAGRQVVPFSRKKRQRFVAGDGVVSYGEFVEQPTPIADLYGAELAENRRIVDGLTAQGYEMMTAAQYVANYWSAADEAGALAFLDHAKTQTAEGRGKKRRITKAAFSHVVVLPSTADFTAPALAAIRAGWPHEVRRDIRDDQTVVLIRGDDRFAIADAIDPLTVVPFRLFDYQRRDVTEMLLKDRVLLAYQMGLGKTRSSIAYARALPIKHADFRRTLILAPAFLVEEWLLEMRKLGIPEREISVLKRADALAATLPNGRKIYDWSRWNLRRYNLLSMSEVGLPDDPAFAVGADGQTITNEAGDKKPLMEFNPAGGEVWMPMANVPGDDLPTHQQITVTHSVPGFAPYSITHTVAAGEPMGAWVPVKHRYPPEEWGTAWLDAHGQIDCGIVDEAYKMKEMSTDVSRAIWQLHPRFRVQLSGTPIKSIPEEGWPLFAWLLEDVPGLFAEFLPDNGGLPAYRNTFGSFVAKLKQYRDKDTDQTIEKTDFGKNPSPAFSNIAFFQGMTGGFMKRRVREEVRGEADVPNVREPIVEDVPITMDERARAFYRDLAADFETGFREYLQALKSGDDTDFNFMAEMGKILRAMTTVQAGIKGCADLDVAQARVQLKRLDAGWKPKKKPADELRIELETTIRGAEMLGGNCGPSALQSWIILNIMKWLGERDADGQPRKVVLFVQDKKALAYYEGEFVGRGVPVIAVSGEDSLSALKSTGMSPRRVKIDTFRTSADVNLLVATIDSMAEGVNLPEASVGFFDHWDWTPSKMNQAMFRMVRPAQRNQVRVFVPYFRFSVWEYARFLNRYKAASLNAAFDGEAGDEQGSHSLASFMDFINAMVSGDEEAFFTRQEKQPVQAPAIA